jgi:hypothetical protein
MIRDRALQMRFEIRLCEVVVMKKKKKKKNTFKQESARYCDLYGQKHHHFALMLSRQSVGPYRSRRRLGNYGQMLMLSGAGRQSVGPNRSRRRLGN